MLLGVSDAVGVVVVLRGRAHEDTVLHELLQEEHVVRHRRDAVTFERIHRGTAAPASAAAIVALAALALAVGGLYDAELGGAALALYAAAVQEVVGQESHHAVPRQREVSRGEHLISERSERVSKRVSK